MENSINEINFNNSEDSYEVGNNINEFNSIEAELDYYKKQYFLYKSKYDYIDKENNKLLKERNKLLFQISHLKKDQKNFISKNNYKINSIININDNGGLDDSNDDKFDIEKELANLNQNIYHKNNIINESMFKTFKEETNEQNLKINELLSNKNDNNLKELENKVLQTIQTMHFKNENEEDDKDDSDSSFNKFQINSDKNIGFKKTLSTVDKNHVKNPRKTFNKDSKSKMIFDQKNIIINSILNNNKRINDNDNDINKNEEENQELLFDDNIIEKSLTNEFISYKKDSINYRKLINAKELKINKLYNLLKRWEYYSKVLKKGIETFYKSIEMFNKNLLNIENDSFNESPDLLGLIYLLQKKLDDVVEHCKSFMSTIDSLFILQLENFKKKQFQKVKILRYNLALKITELINLQNKFLSTKKSTYSSNSFKSAKNNYYIKYKTIEIYKYDYICALNKIMMLKQIELPQIISLLSFSLMVFFRQINEALKEVDAPIKDNLEKINKRINIKNKIIENMKNNKKELENKIFNNKTVDKNLVIKEGFLNVKEIETNSNFKRRYAIIDKGNIICHKTRKSNMNTKEDGFDSKLFLNMIERIDLSAHYNLCNLLLSNVRKNEKKYEFPFCFEIVDASTKKNYILQADTEYEADEWVNAIQNAITDNISNNFKENDENSSEQSDKNNLNSTNISLKSDKNDNNLNNNEIINDIINNNICADCGAEKPTWLCTNWLTVLCIDCSSIHRGLGANISKVKGFRLDNISNESIELLKLLKQEDINKILESNLYQNRKPKPNSKNEVKEEFIIDKYKNKKYLEESLLNNKEDIISSLANAIDENKLLDVYKLIKQNIDDINEMLNINGEEYGIPHYCAGFGKVEMIKLLYLLGADYNKEDTKGLKPIIYAKLNKNTEVIEYLNKKEKI